MQYEVEIKCLVEDAERAKGLPDEIRDMGLTVEQTAEYRQLNDYYVGGNIEQLAANLTGVIADDKLATLRQIAAENDTFSVRGRQNNDAVIFMLKATKGGSANHAAQRAELEAPVAISLDELRDIILASGYELQARWMAHRTLYRLGNGITLDNIFSPGYGYQVEFELVVDGKDKTTEAERQVREFAAQLGLEQVDPERMERMFDYYNAHGQEYYGTEKTFHIE